ncbi:MAG TPA: hypothetical protein VMO80_06480 [Terriglobales bacterium]|jgi:hypothetical protein|nr:hypothetical protein [Terriglobales bacterium]
MIPALRQQFNANFTPEKYQRLLKLMEERCGTPIKFRLCETPCFFPKPLLDQMTQYGKELVQQLNGLEYRKASFDAIPPDFNVPNESPHPMFIQVDFGLVRDAAGKLQPKLVELQGFPSLYAYQAMLSQVYMEVYGLDANLQYLLGGVDWEEYKKLLRRAIVADHDPLNVILMEIDPLHQKTLPDFVLTEKLLGIKTIAITDIKKVGEFLFYESGGQQIPIRRIYNRTIVDELVRKNLKLAFNFTDNLQVEWAGHPNWYFRMSKFSLPYLKHECVPQSWFLDRVKQVPDDLDHYILKPLFSFAGLGVMINPRKEDLAEIPQQKRSDYILQERLQFEPVIETPHGPTKAEVRIMYLWLDDLLPVMTIIRMGRGLMMGVDHNRNLEWVGASSGLYSQN